MPKTRNHKSFITMCNDEYAPKYANDPIKLARRTVLVGTINPEAMVPFWIRTAVRAALPGAGGDDCAGGYCRQAVRNSLRKPGSGSQTTLPIGGACPD